MDLKRCAVCGVALLGATVAHVCVADTFGDERPRGVVMATAAPVFGAHEDHPEEPAADLEIFARQVVAVGTTSEPMPPGQSMLSEDVVLRSYRRSVGHPAYLSGSSSNGATIWSAANEAKKRAIADAVPLPSSTQL
jgi:hypothetical protein